MVIFSCNYTWPPGTILDYNWSIWPILNCAFIAITLSLLNLGSGKMLIALDQRLRSENKLSNWETKNKNLSLLSIDLVQGSGGWGWDGTRVGISWFCNIWVIPYPLKCILQNRKTVKPHCNVKWLHQTEMQSRVQVDRGTRDLLQNESKLTEWNDKIIPSSATNVYITTCQCCWHDTVFLDLHILLKYIICSQTYKKLGIWEPYSRNFFEVKSGHFSEIKSLKK